MVRNSDKRIYINRISPACQACRTGEGSSRYFISLKCHRDCYFCFNPNQQDYEYYRTHTRDTLAELDEYANVEIYRKKGYRIKAIRIVCSTITGMPVGYRLPAAKQFALTCWISRWQPNLSCGCITARWKISTLDR